MSEERDAAAPCRCPVCLALLNLARSAEANERARLGASIDADPLVAALARYIAALDRRFPGGPEQMRREAGGGKAAASSSVADSADTVARSP